MNAGTRTTASTLYSDLVQDSHVLPPCLSPPPPPASSVPESNRRALEELEPLLNACSLARPTVTGPDASMSTTPGGISPITQVLETEELIGTIFQILACLVRQDLRVNLHDWLNSNSSHIKYRGRRPQWTNFFARVALVNRAFFHASVGVLWEHVNDFHPFFALLESCSTGKRTLVRRLWCRTL